MTPIDGTWSVDVLFEPLSMKRIALMSCSICIGLDEDEGDSEDSHNQQLLPDSNTIKSNSPTGENPQTRTMTSHRISTPLYHNLDHSVLLNVQSRVLKRRARPDYRAEVKAAVWALKPESDHLTRPLELEGVVYKKTSWQMQH